LTLVKIKGGMEEISISIVKALPTTELPEYIIMMAIYYTAAGNISTPFGTLALF